MQGPDERKRLPEKRCDNVITLHGTPTVCNALLFRGEIMVGTIEKKCNKCKKIHTIEGTKRMELVYIVR
jgi:phage FluMu protein Com